MPFDPYSQSSISPPHWIRLHGPWQVAALAVAKESDLLVLRSLAVDDFGSAASVDSTISDEQRQELVRLRGEIIGMFDQPQRISFPTDWRRWRESLYRDSATVPQKNTGGQSAVGRLKDIRSADQVDNVDVWRAGETQNDSASKRLGECWFWLSRHFGSPTGLTEEQSVNLVLRNFSDQGLVFLNSNPLASLGLLDSPHACISIPIRSQLLQRNLIEILVRHSVNENVQQNETGVEESISLEICQYQC